MLINYARIAIRNLHRNPMYTLINVGGLAIGMTCVVLIVLFIKHELSYDNFHSKKHDLYRVTTTVREKDGSLRITGASGQVQGPAFKEAIPEIMDYARFWNVGGFNIIGNQKALYQEGLYADGGFLRLFSFPLLYGDPNTALIDPFSIVLTEKTALKYFGRTDVVGETLKIEEQGFQPLKVTGVAKEIPSNSSIRYDVLISFGFLEKFFTDANWLNQYMNTFVLLRPGVDPTSLQKKFQTIFQAKARDQILDPKKNEGYPTQLTFGLQSLKDVHLGSLQVSQASGISDGSNFRTLYLLGGIAGFILLMACINFVNMSIAHSLKRTKEIGVRKINGSSRLQIVGQFMVEAALVCCISFLLALLLSNTLLPLFNSLIGRHLKFELLREPQIWLSWLVLIIVSIIMAGLYPALVLSRFNAVDVLYNKQKPGGKHWLGKSLVVFQFTLATALIISTIVYYRQMHFMLNKDLGYNPDNVIAISLPPQRDPNKLVQNFRRQLASEPSIILVAGTNSWGDGNPVKTTNKEISSLKLRADEYYLQALGIPIKEGRNFSAAFGTDSNRSIIVNETFVIAAGWSDPIGQQVKVSEWEGELTMTVIGVVKDYHYNSLKQPIGPQVFVMDDYEKLIVKAEPAQALRALKAVEKVYKRTLADSPFQFSFMDDDIKNQYGEERHWQRIISYATALSIFISCLGLFGLSYLAAGRRMKEIGIRKVLGASVPSIAGLLSADFLKLVLIAFVIASPLTAWAMHNWLQNFAYRLSISWWIFILAGLAGMFIALLTVSYQAIKAGLANPVDSLRSE